MTSTPDGGGAPPAPAAPPPAAPAAPAAPDPASAPAPGAPAVPDGSSGAQSLLGGGDAAGYDLETPDGADAGLVRQFAHFAAGLGIPREQAAATVNFLNSLPPPRLAPPQDEVKAALTKEWGGDFGRNLEAARRAVQTYGGPELTDLLDRTGLGDHPALLRAFAAAGVGLTEAKPPPTPGGHSAPKETKQGLMNDAAFMAALHSRTHPDHDAAVARWAGAHYAH